MDPTEALEQGRAAYVRRAWAEAFDSLSRADRATPLATDDLALLATAGFLVGREEESLAALDRAHQAHLAAGEVVAAARQAFWMGFQLVAKNEMARASGWLARAQRLLEREGGECVERGYLLLPAGERHLAGGEYEACHAIAARAAEIGERFGDSDLVALALYLQGRALTRLGRVEEGLERLDEAMVSVTTGELSPVITGIVYCGVISACQEVYSLRRAHEWTAALTRWCEDQPDMVAFAGQCRVQRAEILLLQGAWREALEEARRAGDRAAQAGDQPAVAASVYQQGEVHRLLGEFDAAEAAFAEASRRGREPHPGLARLRLAQGKSDAAVAAIRRVAGETANPLKRTKLLPAFVEIMLAAGEVEEARSACRELGAVSDVYGSSAFAAVVAGARGAVELAGGDARAALVVLREALQAWQEMNAPYEAARVRVLVGLACRHLGDEDSAVLEFEAARAEFERLGAAPDIARLGGLAPPAAPPAASGLTTRELQVLRLVATGLTNRAIAADLALSERTIDRHVSNIFTKLGVPTRAAATAHAYQHKLI